LREERRLRVFENRVLGRIFETKRDEVIHNEGLSELYSSATIIRVIKSRRMRWAGHVARMGSVAYRVLVRNPEGKRPIGRPRHRRENSMMIDLLEVE
jgi:hypothetical protein